MPDVCTECDGEGEVLDAPGDVLDGRTYWETCPLCKGVGTVLRMGFFGVWSQHDSIGHSFFTPTGLALYEWGPFTAAEFDQDFGGGKVPEFYINDLSQPEEPLTVTTYSRNGQPYTIIACWDRSGDRRMNSKAAFVAEGFHDKFTMVKEASMQFPAITARLKSFQSGAAHGWGTVNQL